MNLDIDVTIHLEFDAIPGLTDNEREDMEATTRGLPLEEHLARLRAEFEEEWPSALGFTITNLQMKINE